MSLGAKVCPHLSDGEPVLQNKRNGWLPDLHGLTRHWHAQGDK